MSLKVIRRADRANALTIIGTVAGQRIRRRAQSDDRRLAEEEAAALEAEILRSAWHGERRGIRTVAEAMNFYLDTIHPKPATQRMLAGILRTIGPDALLSDVDQEMINRLTRIVLRPDAAPSTVVRNLIVPLRAVLNNAAAAGWCEPPRFRIPRQPQGRTRYLLPHEAEHLVQAAPIHLQVLLVLLLGTGARMSEALELQWRDVDLHGRRVIFWKTKGGRRRVAELPMRAMVALAALSHRDGSVIRTHRGLPYRDTDRQGGGQIKSAWHATLRRAGLDRDLSPHDLRHTWASWHYAINRDPLRLKDEGGWSSLALVERYAHLLPAGQEQAIADFWHLGDTKKSEAV